MKFVHKNLKFIQLYNFISKVQDSLTDHTSKLSKLSRLCKKEIYDHMFSFLKN
jgi:hypothetical protein